MAQRVHVVLEDDLDGSNADETVMFGLDGVNYEIDLSSKNATKLRDALSKYVDNARRTHTRGRRSGGRRSSTNAASIREWARSHGYEVSDRGRVPADIKAAYDAAH
ncbi:MAG TPA: Lsr2 family protein [Nocardioidaceae bacterium]